MRLVLISGLSGSGKSIALRMLEDSGYYCVDNLPPQLLPPLINHLAGQGSDRVAVAVDVRGGDSLLTLPEQIAALRAAGHAPQFLFLDAKDGVLLKRFSETRRAHPLARDGRSLAEAIAEERRRLESLSGLGHHIDTSDLAAATLRSWVRQFVDADSGPGITLMFQSFGFKHGLPLDADLVFDVRCLPNPYYDPLLRPLTGRDPAVADFLAAQPDVARMRADIERFVADWLPAFIGDSRSYLTVAIGCTGGQHRSVYLAESLAQRFAGRARILLRHRELA